MGLGNSGMDIQDKLRDVTRSLFKEELTSCRVYVHQPNPDNLYQFCVIIVIKTSTTEVKGSASGTSLSSTYIRALSECGENIISRKLGLENRSGLAGGLLLGNCIQRAKAELIERDAFLYHYIHLIPFKKVSFEKDEVFLKCFLQSVDPSYKVTLIFNQSYLTDPDTCLLLGAGCGATEKIAFKKALAEYSGMLLNHKIFSGCGPVNSKVDFHHSQSRDSRNKTIIRSLVDTESESEIRSYNGQAWKIEVLESPIRFFKYVLVDHPDLLKMTFGTPHFFPQLNKNVYHPFW